MVYYFFLPLFLMSPHVNFFLYLHITELLLYQNWILINFIMINSSIHLIVLNKIKKMLILHIHTIEYPSNLIYFIFYYLYLYFIFVFYIYILFWSFIPKSKTFNLLEIHISHNNSLISSFSYMFSFLIVGIIRISRSDFS